MTKIYKRILAAARKARRLGVEPEIIILNLNEAEEVFDWLVREGHLNPHHVGTTGKVLGLTMVIDERKIIRLN